MKKLPILFVLVFLIGIMTTAVFAYPKQDGAQASNNAAQWSCASLAVMPQAAPVQGAVDKTTKPGNQANDTNRLQCDNTQKKLGQTNTTQRAVNQTTRNDCLCEGNPGSCIYTDASQADCSQCPQYMTTGNCLNDREPVKTSAHHRHQSGHHR